jgi:hypothetical protein
MDLEKYIEKVETYYQNKTKRKKSKQENLEQYITEIKEKAKKSKFLNLIEQKILLLAYYLIPITRSKYNNYEMIEKSLIIEDKYQTLEIYVKLNEKYIDLFSEKLKQKIEIIYNNMKTIIKQDPIQKNEYDKQQINEILSDDKYKFENFVWFNAKYKQMIFIQQNDLTLLSSEALRELKSEYRIILNDLNRKNKKK